MIFACGDGSGSAVTGGVATYCFSDMEGFLTNGDTNPTPSVWAFDNVVRLAGQIGVGVWGVGLWVYGQTPLASPYAVGNYPAAGGGGPLVCVPITETQHLAIVDGSTHIDSVRSALAARSAGVHGWILYSGAVPASSATDPATLDSYSATAELLGAEPAYDVQAAIDFSVSTPHKLHVERLAARGVKTWGEAWEQRGLADLQGWLPWQAGCAAVSAGVNPTDTGSRAGLAISAPATWHTRPSLRTAGNRAAVIILNNGPTPAQRTSTMAFWMRRGYDVWTDFGSYTEPQIRHALGVAKRFASRGGRGRGRA